MTNATAHRQPAARPFWKANGAPLLLLILLCLLPLIIATLDGQSIADLLTNQAGQAKFIQGLIIEMMILALYALSYELIFGITGLLSFGHAMFFAVGAYLTGIMLKSFGWSLLPTLGLLLGAAVVQALLFSIVLPRVKGVTFALVTLGIAEVVRILIESREMSGYTGANVGLQGIIPPALINPTSERLRFYFLVLAITVAVYLLCRRFVNSPTGRVCIAIRENEGRARMLGYNTFYFKLVALIVSACIAGLAGTLHALYKPIVSPDVAGMGNTVNALLMVLIGGVGTLDGALVGAVVFRLLSFFLDKWFGESAGFILGAVYVALVLFVPYGIVGTWRLRAFRVKEGWKRLGDFLRGAGVPPRPSARRRRRGA